MKVPTGGRKKKFSVSIAATDTTSATRRRAMVAVPSTTSRSATAAVVGLTSGIIRSSPVTAAIAARLPSSTMTFGVGRGLNMVNAADSDT